MAAVYTGTEGMRRVALYSSLTFVFNSGAARGAAEAIKGEAERGKLRGKVEERPRGEKHAGK